METEEEEAALVRFETVTDMRTAVEDRALEPPPPPGGSEEADSRYGRGRDEEDEEDMA